MLSLNRLLGRRFYSSLTKRAGHFEVTSTSTQGMINASSCSSNRTQSSCWRCFPSNDGGMILRKFSSNNNCDNNNSSSASVNISHNSNNNSNSNDGSHNSSNNNIDITAAPLEEAVEKISSPSEETTVLPAKKSSTLSAYLELSKFRLSSLVVATTGAGFVCSGIYPIDIATATFACVGTALCAASAGTFNQVIETDRDRLMNRTKMRPLPSGRISKSAAIAFGSATTLIGTTMLYTMCNPTVAYLGLANVVMYAGIYTYSKQYTELNTWIGAIVGAIPPMMGWAAASGGSILEAEPIALGTLLFLWQFPHFFSLSWMYRDDYARGGFQMVACNDPVGDRSANLVMRYSQYLTLFPVVTSVLGLTSYMFLLEGTVVNIYLLSLAKKFKNNHSNANARKIFLTSLWYLPAVLLAYLFHSRTWNRAEDESNRNGIALDQVSEYMLDAREAMKNFCLHEVFVTTTSKSNDESNSTHSLSDQAKDETTSITTMTATGSEEKKKSSSSSAMCPKTAINNISNSMSSMSSSNKDNIVCQDGKTVE